MAGRVSAQGIRVLSIDGGGIRAMAPLKILEELERETGKKTHELFDLICGSSAGGVLALLLGRLKLSASQAREILTELNNEVFEQGRLAQVRKWRLILSLATELLSQVPVVGNLLQPRITATYSASNYEATIKDSLSKHSFKPDEPLESSSTPRVFVTARKNGQYSNTYLFRTYSDTADKGSMGSSSVEIWQALRATTAAPTFFDPLSLNGDFYYDGCIGCTNPSELALREIERIPEFLDRGIRAFVSLGTGAREFPRSIDQASALIGILAEVAFQSEEAHERLQVQSKLNKDGSRWSYFRFNPPGLHNIDSDDPSQISEVRRICDDYYGSSQIENVRTMASLVMQPQPTDTTAQPGVINVETALPVESNYDIFLSHAGKQKFGVAEQMYDALRECGLNVFFDVVCLPDQHQTSKSRPLIVGLAKTIPMGVFVVSKQFLCKEWPTLEFNIFDGRKSKNTDTGILPLFYWNGFDVKNWEKISPIQRDAAKKLFDSLSQWSGKIQGPREFNSEAVAKVAEIALRETVKGDIRRALTSQDQLTRPQLSFLLNPENVAILKNASFSQSAMMKSVLEISERLLPAPKSVLRFAFYSVPSRRFRHFGVELVDVLLKNHPVEKWGNISTGAFPIVWKTKGGSMNEISDGIRPLAEQLRIPPAVITARQDKTPASWWVVRRVLRVLQNWPAPWLLLIQGIGATDINQIDKWLSPPMAPIVSTGLVVVTTESRTQFETTDGWTVLHWTNSNL